MKNFCLNCFRRDVPLDWKGLFNSCSVKGVDLGTRYDFLLVLIMWIWGFLWFTQFFHFDSMLGQFVVDNVIGGYVTGDLFFLFIVVFYILIYIIPSFILKKRNPLIYYGLNILFVFIHPLYRIISFLQNL